MSEDWRWADVLIEFNGLCRCYLRAHPDADPGLVVRDPNAEIMFKAGRRMSLLPMAPIAAERYIVADAERLRPVYHVFAGAFVISDAIRQLLDQFDCPRIEYFPADAFQLRREADYDDPIRLGKPAKEPYWLINCYNNYDIIDKQRTVSNWHWPSETWLSQDEKKPPEWQQFARDDPPSLSNPTNIMLSEVPSDALFGIVGLPDKRFVSEAFFDAVVRSDLYESPYQLPFVRFDLRNGVPITPGYNPRHSPDKRIPMRLNCRMLYWGDLRKPLDFPRNVP